MELGELFSFSLKPSRFHCKYYSHTIDLIREKMCNVNTIYFENFEYGCDMSVLISEYETGPYTYGKKIFLCPLDLLVIKNKFFPRSTLRRVKLGTLPCKYIKIIVHKGGLVNPASLHVFGFSAEDASELFGEEYFQLLVANPQRLMYY
jgi:hypothetical protein